VQRFASTTSQWLKRHQLILVLLFAAFLIRFLLADWNSYWNDEILSVVIYGAGNQTVVDAISKLANNSIHPPLYQFLLYNWMLVFGDVEVSTRSLSNLYVTVAGLFLYLTVNVHWTRRTAFFSAAAFSITNLAIQYGLESRSYAQTIFLVSLSSYVLIRTLTLLIRTQQWALRPHWFSVLIFIGANTALTLTHYYNLFWLLAQALFTLVFLVVELPKNLWLKGTLSFVVIFAAAPALFSIVWGWVFFPQFRSRAGEFQVDDATAKTPIQLLNTSLFAPNVSGGVIGGILVAVLVIALLVASIVRMARSREGQRSAADWGIVHLAWWLTMPLIVVYLVFTLLSVERYQVRYFIFSLPPLSALVVIATGALTVLIGRRVSALRSNTLTTMAMALTAIVVFLPGGFEGATDRKTDWRGNTQRILSVIESDPGREYYLIETSFGSSPRSNYYFERFSENVRIDQALPTRFERDGKFSQIDEGLAIKQPDRVIVIFNHLRTERFPNLLEHLEVDYDRVTAQFDRGGRAGYVMFERAPSE
jgi:uncharacterized membrane protein